MSISLITNTASLSAQRNFTQTQSALQSSIDKLSSGERITKASDDAAGLGISESLRADIRSLQQASRNAQDGVAMTQVAEGSLNEIQGMVSRMRELATQAANDTLGDTERGYLDAEYQELSAEITRVANDAEFNGKMLLDGSLTADLTMQVGKDSGDTVSVNLQDGFTATDLTDGTTTVDGTDVTTSANASDALAVLDAAIDQVSSKRADIGAFQNKLDTTTRNLGVAVENLQAADSRIRDVDVASETAKLTRNQILSQAGTAVLAQANQLPSAALALLG